jgi:hypothetical protein
LSAPAFAFRLDVPLDQVCAASSLVVVGEVTTASSAWAPGQRAAIETWVDVAVERVAKGRLVSDSVLVRVPGGRIGDVALWVEDAPELEVDQRYLLLLTPTGDGSFVVTGGDVGSLPLRATTPTAEAWLSVLPECVGG